MSVIPFNRLETDDQHGAGKAFCFGCKHEWIAVAPTGLTEFECPNCGAYKGRWRFGFYPALNDEVWECACGNQLFYMTPDGHLCANCGIYQSY